MNDQSIIAKGRQRFRLLNLIPSEGEIAICAIDDIPACCFSFITLTILSTRLLDFQFDRLLMARIELLPNNSTPDALPTAAFDRWPRLAVSNYEVPPNSGSPPPSPVLAAPTPAPSPTLSSSSSRRHKPTSISWWPHWVYAQYDQKLLAARARELLRSTDTYIFGSLLILAFY